MVIRKRYQSALREIGLSALDDVKAFDGDLIKDQRGKRDVLRFTARGDIYFLKRIWKPKFKHGIGTLLRRGRVWSQSRIEWCHTALLARHRIRVPKLVAYGEECTRLRERFSFIVTRAAPGEMDLRDFVENEADPRRRGAVFQALAREVRRIHDRGFALPDLFARHLFISWRHGQPRFTVIDVQRINHRRGIGDRLRARDLAALNSSLPVPLVRAVERVRFLRNYHGRRDRRFYERVRRRMLHLLVRNKRLNFHSGDVLAEAAKTASGIRRPPPQEIQAHPSPDRAGRLSSAQPGAGRRD